MSPQVSVLIVTWNSSAYIVSCIRSAIESADGLETEVIVVDNASSDETVEKIRDAYRDVRLIQTGSNLGFARAMNIAIRVSTGRFLFLLNPDTMVQGRAIRQMVELLRSCSTAGAVGPAILQEDGQVDPFGAREFPSVSGSIFLHFGLRRFFPRHFLFSRAGFADRYTEGTIGVPCLIGAALMVPREVIIALGELDEQLPMYFEDLDLCNRIAATGKKLYYLANANVMHKGGGSAAVSPERLMLYAMEDGEAPLLYFRRYGFFGSAYLFRLVVLTGNLMRVVLFSPRVAGSWLTGEPLAERTKTILARAQALAAWSLMSSSRFQCRWSKMFDSEPAQSSTDSLPRVA